jgi:hypothetical protein
MSIDEERVDRRFGYLRSFMDSAWHGDLAEVEALIERIRVELMIGECDHATKAFYRAAVHCLEEVAAQRHGQLKTDRLEVRHAVADYLKALVEGLRQ